MESELRTWLNQFSSDHPRWGWKRAYHQLRREGWRVNKKRIQRLWRTEGLKVPYRKRKKPLRGVGAIGAMCPIRPNVLWGRSQVVNATSSLNLSAGVSHVRVLRGRSLSSAAIAWRSSCEWMERSVPFGKN